MSLSGQDSRPLLRLSILWWVASGVILLDQLTKYWAVVVLKDRGSPIVIIENFFRLAYAENRGGAAGILSSHPQLLTVLSIVALGVIIWWARSVPVEETVARLGFGAILGGATGNLLDRLFRGGFFQDTYVVDFMDAHWYARYHWPTFNLADSAICIGIALILFAHVRSYRREAAVRDESKTGAKKACDDNK